MHVQVQSVSGTGGSISASAASRGAVASQQMTESPMDLTSKCRQCSYEAANGKWKCPECGSTHATCAIALDNDFLVSRRHVNMLSLALSLLSVMSVLLISVQAHRESMLERSRIAETFNLAGRWRNSINSIVSASHERAYAERELTIARDSVGESLDALNSIDNANFTWLAQKAHPYVGTSLYGVSTGLLMAMFVGTSWTLVIAVVLVKGWSRGRVSRSTITILVGSVLWCMCLLSGGVWTAVT